MVVGKLTQDVSLLGTGFSRTAGSLINSNDVPPAVWKLWVERGIVLIVQHPTVSKRELANSRRRRKMI